MRSDHSLTTFYSDVRLLCATQTYNLGVINFNFGLFDYIEMKGFSLYQKHHFKLISFYCDFHLYEFS